MIAPTLANPDFIFARLDDFTAFSLSKKPRFKLLCSLLSGRLALKYVYEVDLLDLELLNITF